MATSNTNGPTTIGKNLIDREPRTPQTGEGGESAESAPTDADPSSPEKKPPKKAPAKKRTPRKKTTVPDPVEPWDQRKEETGPAYEAFLAYRDMGLTRSLSKVARELGKSTVLMSGWSSKHSWVIRAAAYDKHLDREWVLETKERRRKAARRNADMAAKAMDLVALRIEQMEKHFDFTDEEFDKEHPPPLDVLDLRRLVDSLGRLERLSLGESTENVQVTGKDGKDLVPDLTQLSASDLKERLKQIRDSIDKRLDESGGDDLEATG